MDDVTITGTREMKMAFAWAAPELLNFGDSSEHITGHAYQTKASDVWAFGMVVYVRVNSFEIGFIVNDPHRKRFLGNCHTAIALTIFRF